MGTIGKDFKYKIIKSFLSKDEIDLLNIYCEMRHRTNLKRFGLNAVEVNPVMDSDFYGDPIMESVLLKKLSLMEKETNKQLLPTYSFWRMYTKFSDLKTHVDRSTCEISVTVHIGSDGTKWPFFVDDTAYDLDPGDAAIYLGMDVKHGREEFQGDWYSQCFLHYVDKNGKYTNQFRDNRTYWGVPKYEV